MDGTPMRNFYSQDGEAEILVPAVDEVVQSAFAQCRTDFVKGPPSATGIHQSWDRNTSFRDTKKGMETVTKNGINTSDVTLAKNIKIALAGLRTQSPEAILSSAIENKIIKAIETLVYVQQNGYVQKRKHTMGYQVTTTVDRICCKYSLILSTHLP